MGEIITAIILILLATVEARFPSIMLPSLFLSVYVLWVLKSRMRQSHILLVSFVLGVVMDAIDPSHVWLYPFFMPFSAWMMLQVKLKMNLTLSPVRIVIFTILAFILLLPIYLYYNLSFVFVFLKSFGTAVIIEGVLLLLWRGELS